MNIKNLFFVLLLAPAVTYGQTCKCGKAFDWMVNLVETNDAGIGYFVEQYGETAYYNFTNAQRNQAWQTRNTEACRQLMQDWIEQVRPGQSYVGINHPNNPMYDWLQHFKPAHLYVDYHTAIDIPAPGTASAYDLHQGLGYIHLTRAQLQQQLDSVANPDPLEGIWQGQGYTLGVIADSQNPDVLYGFILDSDNPEWVPEQLKAQFYYNPQDNIYNVDYYMLDHSAANMEAILLSPNVMDISGDRWNRVYPLPPLSKGDSLVAQSCRIMEPLIAPLSPTTAYVYIPSADKVQKPLLDNLVGRHQALLRSCPNLIIDIRSSTGGSLSTFEVLMPYLYTNPMYIPPTELLATPTNAQGYRNYARIAQHEGDSLLAQHYLNAAQAMDNQPGQFVLMDIEDNNEAIDVAYNPEPYPKNVAIIINSNNKTGDEEFLLMAKQSQKVTLFGQPTKGEVDLLEMNYVFSPDGVFVIGYCMGRSTSLPGMPIDGVGIQPDYYIEPGVPDYQWVGYVQRMLEGK